MVRRKTLIIGLTSLASFFHRIAAAQTAYAQVHIEQLRDPVFSRISSEKGELAKHEWELRFFDPFRQNLGPQQYSVIQPYEGNIGCGGQDLALTKSSCNVITISKESSRTWYLLHHNGIARERPIPLEHCICADAASKVPFSIKFPCSCIGGQEQRR